MQFLVSLLQDVSTVDLDIEATAASSRSVTLLLDLLVEVLSLAFEVEQIRHILDNIDELETEICPILATKQLIDSLLVVEAEDAELVEALRQLFIHVLEQAEDLVVGRGGFLLANGLHFDIFLDGW